MHKNSLNLIVNSLKVELDDKIHSMNNRYYSIVSEIAKKCLDTNISLDPNINNLNNEYFSNLIGFFK